MSTAEARTSRAGAFFDCALVVVPCTFSDLVVTFRGRRRGSLSRPSVSTPLDLRPLDTLFGVSCGDSIIGKVWDPHLP